MKDDYYNIKAMSATAIKAGAVSMAHMAVIIDGDGYEETPAMRAGTLAHMAILEPLRFISLAVVDVATKAAKDWKAAVEQYGEEWVITRSEYVAACGIATSMNNHTQAMRILSQVNATETALYWEIDGNPCKSRIDGMCESGKIMVEYKTTGSLATFSSAAARMHYHLQLGWYWLGVKTVKGVEPKVYVIAQEQKPPYDVAVYQVPSYCLMMWADEAVAIARRWWSGERGGAYPDMMTFELPSWADHAGDVDELDISAFGL